MGRGLLPPTEDFLEKLRYDHYNEEDKEVEEKEE